MPDEHATTEATPTPPDTDLGIGTIFQDALTAQTTPPTPASPPDTEPGTEDTATVTTATPPFLELVISPTQKIPFATESDFTTFVESNDVLKRGWLRQADYTRKTTDLAHEREAFTQQQAEDQAAWGKIRPDDASRQALQQVWSTFQDAATDPLIQDAIQRFVQDVQLIARGQAPTGPLAALSTTAPVTGAPDATVPLKREIASLARKHDELAQALAQDRQATAERLQQAQAAEADRTVAAWMTGKESSGTTLSPDELEMMADFMSIVDDRGQPKLSLDAAYVLARTQLGKTQADATKTVIQDAKRKAKTSATPPRSNASAGEEPEPATIGGILKQGIAQLAGT